MIAKEIAKEAQDKRLGIRLDTLCMAFPRNYLDYQAHIGKNLGLFYRCTGRMKDISGEWFPTYSCYVAVCHDHWYEVDWTKWRSARRIDWSIGCDTGYMCAFCGVWYKYVDLRDRLFVVGNDGVFGPGKSKNGQHYYAIGDAADHKITEQEWRDLETMLDL